MQTMTETLQNLIGKPLVESTDQEIYLALLDLVRSKSAAQVRPVNGRKLYYISAEFLIGKLLSNNLINLGLYDDVRDALAAAGKSLSDIEEVEPEPSLGNGGLGRLAACFLDSLATLNLPGDGIGLRYHFGLFRQSFADGLQNELPDPWLNEHSWAEKTDITYPVTLAGKPYTARLYKLAVTGYEGRTNTLNLFDLDTIDESIVHDGIQFDKTAIAKNLTLFLYPDDSDEAGPHGPALCRRFSSAAIRLHRPALAYRDGCWREQENRPDPRVWFCTRLPAFGTLWAFSSQVFYYHKTNLYILSNRNCAGSSERPAVPDPAGQGQRQTLQASWPGNRLTPGHRASGGPAGQMRRESL